MSLNLASYGCVVFHAHDGKTLLQDVTCHGYLATMYEIPREWLFIIYPAALTTFCPAFPTGILIPYVLIASGT